VTPIFADTFFFLAVLNAQDRAFHEKALAANRMDRPMCTSAWVLIELADHLCDERNRHLYGMIVDALRTDSRYEIIPADQKTLDAAVELYRQRADKAWSLTDCTSFVLMRQKEIREALTGDRHFEQAGFTALLK
jgi:predicted nucleic acid-binding protein